MTRLATRNRVLMLAGVVLVALVAGGLVISHLIEACGGLSGCDSNGLPLGAVTVRDLEAHPEATLYYPGATVISHGGTPERATLEGPGSAFTVSILATPDSPDRVYAWYQDWLMAHEWRQADVLRGSAELSVRAWNRGPREIVDVAILDPARMQTAFGNQIPSGQTIVETRYGITPASRTSPTP